MARQVEDEVVQPSLYHQLIAWAIQALETEMSAEQVKGLHGLIRKR